MYSNKYFSIEKCDTKTSLKILFWLFIITGLFILLTVYSPAEYIFYFLGYENTNGCILLTLLGVPCPMCGMGRSLPALMDLDFGKMIYYNPSSLVFYLFAFLVFAAVFLTGVLGYKIIIQKHLMKYWYVAVTILLIVWILNILYGNHEIG